jgi:hypothetical protein
MTEISYLRHLFPPVLIEPAVRVYLRFTFELSRRRGTPGRARARHPLRNRAFILTLRVERTTSLPRVATSGRLGHTRTPRSQA